MFLFQGTLLSDVEMFLRYCIPLPNSKMIFGDRIFIALFLVFNYIPQTYSCHFIISLKGNTGIDSLRDCNKICNGTARNSSCGTCLAPGAIDPALDCNNDCFGEANLDECNVCTGGNTGLVANYLKDVCGTSVVL